MIHKVDSRWETMEMSEKNLKTVIKLLGNMQNWKIEEWKKWDWRIFGHSTFLMHYFHNNNYQGVHLKT